MPNRRDEDVARQVVDAAITVHSSLGPGLLEGAYEACLAFELESRGLSADRQLMLPVHYQAHRVDAGYRLDLLVEGCVIVELKSVEVLLPIHEAQILTYLRLSGIRLGFLMNFNSRRLKDGLRRFVLD